MSNIVCGQRNEDSFFHNFEEVFTAYQEGRFELIKRHSNQISKIRNVCQQTVLMQGLDHPNLVQDFISWKICDLHSKDRDKNNAFYLAIQCRSLSLPIFYRHINILNFNYSNVKGKTAVHLAIEAGDARTLLHLIKARANINELLKVGKYEFSPLLYAVSLGEKECVDLLISKERVKFEVGGIGFLLHVAAFYQQPEMLYHLLHHPKATVLKMGDYVNKPNSCKCRTPISIAAKNGDLESIRHLYEMKADLRLSDSSGNTPLHLAAKAQNALTLHFLSTLQSNLQITNKFHQKALDLLEKESFVYNVFVNILDSKPNVRLNAYAELPKNFALGIDPFLCLGILQIFEEENVIIQRITGNGPSALLAVLLAVGYTVNELLTLEDPLFSFFSKELPFPGWECRLKEMIVSHPLVAHQVDPLEIFRIWVEDLIERKSGKKLLTFDELKELADHNKKNKHLILLIENVKDKTITRFDSEDSKNDNVIISDVLKIAIGIPVTKVHPSIYFKSHNDRVCASVKYKHAKLTTQSPLVKTYDQKKYKKPGKGEECYHNKRTIAFAMHEENLKSCNRTLKLEKVDREESEAQLILRGKSAAITYFKEKKQQYRNFFSISGTVKRLRKYITNAPHDDFIGRSKDLEILRSYYDIDSLDRKASIINLYGQVGVGKTELAIYFALKHEKEFSFIQVIDCTNENSMLLSYKRMADIFEIEFHKEIKLKDLMARVHLKFETDFIAQPWCLIFDNVNEEISLPCKSGLIFIITTEDSERDTSWNKHELLGLTEEESHQFFPNLDQKLVQELNGFPILLNLAKNSIESLGYSSKQYLESIQGSVHPLWENVKNYHQKNVRAALEIQLNHIEKNYPLASEALEYMAYLSPNSISQSFLYYFPKARGKDLQISDPLERFLLLKHDKVNRSISINHLIQVVLQKIISEKKREREIFEKMLLWIVNYSHQFDYRQKKSWFVGEEIHEHFSFFSKKYDKIWNIPSGTNAIKSRVIILNCVASWLGEIRGMPDLALTYLDKALDYCKILPNLQIDSLFFKARCYWKLHRYEESLLLFEEIIELKRRNPKDSYVDLLTILNTAGDCLFNLGKTENAIALYSEALKYCDAYDHSLLKHLRQAIKACQLTTTTPAVNVMNNEVIYVKGSLLPPWKSYGYSSSKINGDVQNTECQGPFKFYKEKENEEIEPSKVKFKEPFIEVKTTDFYKLPSQVEIVNKPESEDFKQVFSKTNLNHDNDIKMLKNNIKDRIIQYGKSHSLTADAWINLGHDLSKKLYFVNALECYRKALIIYREFVFDPETSPDVAKCEIYNGHSLARLKKHSEALIHFANGSRIIYRNYKNEILKDSLNISKIKEDLKDNLKMVVNSIKQTVHCEHPIELIVEFKDYCQQVFGDQSSFTTYLEQLSNLEIQNENTSTCILL